MFPVFQIVHLVADLIVASGDNVLYQNLLGHALLKIIKFLNNWETCNSRVAFVFSYVLLLRKFFVVNQSFAVNGHEFCCYKTVLLGWLWINNPIPFSCEQACHEQSSLSSLSVPDWVSASLFFLTGRLLSHHFSSILTSISVTFVLMLITSFSSSIVLHSVKS